MATDSSEHSDIDDMLEDDYIKNEAVIKEEALPPSDRQRSSKERSRDRSSSHNKSSRDYDRDRDRHRDYDKDSRRSSSSRHTSRRSGERRRRSSSRDRDGRKRDHRHRDRHDDVLISKPKDDIAEKKRRERPPSPQSRIGDPSTTTRCFRCLLKGHRANDCPNEARCRLCRRTGHLEAECPNGTTPPLDKNDPEERKEKIKIPKPDPPPKKKEENNRRQPHRRNRYHDPFYIRSESPECEKQRRDAIQSKTDDRDQRTVICMQLSARIQAQDLFDFFSTVGKVNEVKIIYEKYSRRSKGIAYVEFRRQETIPQAISLTGHKLLGAPIQVQASQAEKNKQLMGTSWTRQTVVGPPKLDIGNLHPDINEEMLKKIFEPFGHIHKVEIVRELHTGRSKCFGSILFQDHASAQKAMEALNGFELAGRELRVTSPEQDKKNISMEQAKKLRNDNQSAMEISAHSTGMHVRNKQNPQGLDTDEIDRGGVNMGATGRLSLMAKLAAGTGLAIPEHAKNVLANANNQAQLTKQYQKQGQIATTPCFQLQHLFNPAEETDANWADEIKSDVLFQCHPLGGICHIYVDQKNAEGVVYLKAPSIDIAAHCVTTLHGRFFGGKMIKASYIPLQAYNYRFPESATLVTRIPLERN